VLQIALDLRDEGDELHAFLQTLSAADWDRPTGFMDWTPWDVIAHLHFFDDVSLASLAGREPFAAKQKELGERSGAGKTGAQVTREALGDLTPAQLMDRWITANHDLCEQLGNADPKARLPWFGPDMGVRMFTTARQMEYWSHGQEIYDLVGAKREPTDRLKNIATIGVRTFGWTFVNRGEEPPGPQPYVRLTAPSGEVWEFGDASDSECVRGTALDFCHVVTQGRNVLDTPLEVTGDVANRWMAIAQCFAGGPIDPPKPGTRG